jgi:hypothetical protein
MAGQMLWFMSVSGTKPLYPGIQALNNLTT